MSALDDILSPENFPPCDKLRAAAEGELAALRSELATVKARLKQYRDDAAPYIREENERIREQERDLRDAYHQGRADADEAHFHDQQGGW